MCTLLQLSPLLSENNDLRRCYSQADKRKRLGATRGVTISMSAFLACHQYYCAGSSLAPGLNLRAVVCGIFWSSSPGVFSGYSSFLPSFIGLMIQPAKEAQINAIWIISALSKLIAELSLRNKWHVTRHLHMISARCVARDLHTIAQATCSCVLETVCDIVRRL